MTIVEMLRKSAAGYPDKVAIRQKSRTVTYDELLYRSEGLAAALLKSGLKKGDKVGVLLPKTPEIFISFLGVAMAGCVYVPLDPTPPRTNLRYVLDLTSPAALIVHAELYPVLSEIELPCDKIIVVGEKPSLQCLGWDEITSRNRALMPGSVDFPQSSDRDVVYLNFTSGTTGVPKGAVTTHSNIYWNTISAVETLGLDSDDVHLCMFPVFVHPHELFARSLYLGGTAVLVDSIYPKSVAKAVSEYKITAMMAVAAIYDAFTRQHETSPLDFGALRIPESGGSFAGAPLVQRFEDLFGTPIYPVWGSTETTGIALAVPPAKGTYRPDSMGKPCRYYEVEIVDEDGAPAPPEVAGEMMVKGPAVCGAYYKNPAESNLHMRDGWFATGDLARKDAEGFFYFMDRKTRMMKVAGMKVFPSEIEKAIMKHPNVREVAVSKIFDRVHGEMPKAYIVLKDGGALDKNEIRRHCEEMIAGYKIPRSIKVMDSLPKTPGGKINYSQLELLD